MEETKDYIARTLLESPEEVVDCNLVMQPAPDWLIQGIAKMALKTQLEK